MCCRFVHKLNYTPAVPFDDLESFYDYFKATIPSGINTIYHNDNQHTYKRLIKCAKCGCYFTAETKNGGHDSGSYTYYHCTNKKKVHLNGLKDWMLSEHVLDLAMQFVLDTIKIPEHVIKLLKDKIMSSLDKVYLSENKKVDMQTNRLKELNLLIKKSYEDKLKGNISEEQFKELSGEWQEEKDLLTIDIQESTDISKSVYRNTDLIIKFCNQIPNIFVNASLEEKQLLLRMIIDEITYDEGGIIQVKLKPIFESLRVIKQVTIDSNVVKVRTQKKPTAIDILEHLNKIIRYAVNSKVRTLETRILK